ncbi:MAG: MoxR family ATPase [Microbacteriaceae bacterium]|jgi:MoxR-like ATPase|nr:MoxR family ATPase [Microbacteriaceae bacterium]
MDETVLSDAEAADFRDVCAGLIAALEGVLLGKGRVIRLALTALLSGGHLLLEDVPGTGKTLLARSLADLFGGSQTRVQFTADLLPADITGAVIFHRASEEFRFRPGPVFTNLFLADEINRASSRAQSALLEAMEERQVSVDGQAHPLPDPFMVIATQNPVDQAGTSPLPEAQLDRFLLRTEVGYPDRAAMLRLLSAGTARVSRLLRFEDLRMLRARSARVYCAPALLEYAIRLAEATRTAPELRLGASVRAVQALVVAARTWAAGQGRPYLIPDDLRGLAGPVLSHRLVPTPEAEVEGVRPEAVLSRILLEVPCPSTGDLR